MFVLCASGVDVGVCDVCVCVRERGREGVREREIYRDRERDRWTEDKCMLISAPLAHSALSPILTQKSFVSQMLLCFWRS